MTRILLTAFEPYAPWTSNASWLALIALTRDLPTNTEITTRLYPSNLSAVKSKLETDMKSNFDIAIHLGQAPNSSCIQLEEVGVNFVADGHRLADQESAQRICDAGPAAYRCQLPIREYAKAIRDAGIPARTSFHAGTYFCNAIMYWSCRLADDLELPTKSMFVHVPLDTTQVLDLDQPSAFMPTEMTAKGLRTILNLIVHEMPQPA